MSITTRNVTRNQSTADISQDFGFLFDNRYRRNEVLNNPSADDPVTVAQFSLVCRDAATDKVVPATAANLANIVGINASGETVLAASGNAPITYGTQGTIAENLIVLPAAVTMSTTVGTVKLRDVLQRMGFDLQPVIENTKFDN